MKHARLRRGLTLTDAEVDEQLRERFHPAPVIIENSEHGVAFQLDPDWIIRIETAHEYLVDLMQLYYDLASRVLENRLSTTVLMNIRTELLTTSSSNSYWSSNRDVFEMFSSRQRLVLAPPERIRKMLDWSSAGRQASWVTIQDKTNWARSQVLDIRRHHAGLKAHSTARQADYLARGFKQALNRPPEQRKRALDNLENQIYVDTRNKLGRPKIWPGLPVAPLPNSRAWLQRRDKAWQLWIERTGVPEDVLTATDQSSTAVVPYDVPLPQDGAWSSDETDPLSAEPRPISRDDGRQGDQAGEVGGATPSTVPGWMTPQAQEIFARVRPAQTPPIHTNSVLQGESPYGDREQSDAL